MEKDAIQIRMVGREFRVLPGGVSISFIKHLNSNPATRGTIGPEGNGRWRLECLHHYDQIVMNFGLKEVGHITRLLNDPEQESIASKRMIGFFLEGESSPRFFDQDTQPIYFGPVVYLILLRFNSRLSGLPSLDMEAILARWMESNFKDVGWAVMHTLAKGEVILILKSAGLSQCEIIVRALQSAVVAPDAKCVSVFDLVVPWPCLTKSSSDYIEQCDDNSDIGTVRGIRVVGICENKSNRYDCIKRTHGRWPHLPHADRSQMIRGIENERQIDLPQLDTVNLLQSILEIRDHKECQSSCCSVYLVRKITDHGHDNFFWDTAAQAGLEERIVIPAYANEPLEAISSTKWCMLIGAHLESIRNQLVQTLQNSIVAPEFFDLLPALGAIHIGEQQMKKFRVEKGDTEKAKRAKAVNITQLRGRIQHLAYLLERAMRDRLREDICAQSHHVHLAPLGASGFSRIAPAGRYAFKRMLENFTTSFAKDAPAPIKWAPLCITGYMPNFSILELFQIVMAPLHATLEPYWYFGLGHELGHAIWYENQPDLLLESKREESEELLKDEFSGQAIVLYMYHVPEVFSDIICLNYTFDSNLHDYLYAWIRHYLELIEYNYGHKLFLEEEDPTNDAIVSVKIMEYYLRLLLVSAYHHFRLKVTGGDLIQRATAEVLKALERILQDEKHLASSKIGINLTNYAKTKHRAAMSLMPALPSADKHSTGGFGRNLEDAVKLLHELIQKYGTPQGVNPFGKPEMNALVNYLKEGKILTLEQIPPFPLALLRQLEKNKGFAVNLAAILSLTDWEEREI